jgi:hypothetical protein
MPTVDSAKKKEDLVYALSKASRCYGCDKRLLENDIVQLKHKENENEVLCIDCAGLSGLELLRSGNASITRLAKKYSKSRYVVMKWSELWKAYERQGLLLERQAIEKARKEAE